MQQHTLITFTLPRPFIFDNDTSSTFILNEFSRQPIHSLPNLPCLYDMALENSRQLHIGVGGGTKECYASERVRIERRVTCWPRTTIRGTRHGHVFPAIDSHEIPHAMTTSDCYATH